MNTTTCLLILAVLSLSEGCHHGKTEHAGDGEVRISRKRREAQGKDARKDLSDFFTECMTRKSPPNLIPSMRNVVDLALRDSRWYKASDSYFCAGRQDNFGCWQGIMDLFIDWDSKLLGPSRECILEFSTKSRTGGYRQKRDIREENIGENGTSYRFCKYDTDKEYEDCMTSEIKVTPEYPSLVHFHWESIAIFIRDHLSRCRVVETGYGYGRDCGFPRYKGPDNKKVDTSDAQCVPHLLLEIIKEESPLRPAVITCNIKLENRTYYEEEITEYGTILVDKVMDAPTEFEFYGYKGKHGGADIVGYCDPKSTFTDWFDTSSPNTVDGDKELLKDIKLKYPKLIMCSYPQGIQVRMTRTDEPWYASKNHLRYMSPDMGLECQNSMQHGAPKCENFKVRFCCYENKHTNTEVHTHTVHPYAKTKDTVGTCGTKDRWSPWMNIDRKRDGGDAELFSNSPLKKQGCDPVAVQGRIARSFKPYTEAYNNIKEENPKVGIVCTRDMQPKEKPCRDFEVRFCCRDGKGAFVYRRTTPRPVTPFRVIVT